MSGVILENDGIDMIEAWYRNASRHERGLVPVNEWSSDDYNAALHLAIAHGETEIVDILLRIEGGASANSSIDDISALSVAVMRNETSIMKILIDAGASFSPDSFHATKTLPPLHWAARGGSLSLDSLSILLSHNFSVDIVNSDGHSALHLAAGNANVEGIKLLLQHGADASIRDNSSATPLIFVCYIASDAEEEDDEEEKRTLVDTHDNGRLLTTPLSSLTPESISTLPRSSRRLLSVRYLVEEGRADVNTVDDSKETILHHAASGGHLSIAKYLCTETNINVNSRNDDGWTALHSAVVSGHKAMVKLLTLFAKGLEISAKDSSGSSALDWGDKLAKESGGEIDPELRDLLVNEIQKK